MTQRPRETKREARERKAAERQRAEQAAAQRRRTTTIAVIATVSVLVIAAIVYGVVRETATKGGAGSSTASGPTVVGQASAPVKIDLWEDPQCPICGEFEKAGASSYVTSLVDSGQAQVKYYTVTFLDQNLNNDSSVRAASAMKCAQAQGGAQKFLAYHNAMFHNQPAEGKGYTDAQLIQFGKDAGLTSDAFATCVKNQTYKSQVLAVTASMTDHQVGGTPTIFVNGKEVNLSGATDGAGLVEKFKAAVAAAQKAPATGTPSPTSTP